jgi:predicted amidophosphoribosyltransferase
MPAEARPRPDHQGVCPYCQEDIKPEAIRCKHCQANLAALRRVPRGQASEEPGGTGPIRASAPAGCNDYEIDESGSIWKFVGDNEDECFYELVKYVPGRL